MYPDNQYTQPVNAPPQVTETVECTLLEARDVLRKCRYSLNCLADKVHGPRPEEATKDAATGDCLRSVAADINSLAHEISVQIAEHHRALGFERNQSVGGTVDVQARKRLG